MRLNTLATKHRATILNALAVIFAIAITVLGFNLVGDGLRDALDPQLREVA